jgi:membrane-bound metal-dependent hydrolase YbcI (DUF457 family)
MIVAGMPSPIGHTLAGLTVGWLSDAGAVRPPRQTRSWKAALRAAFTPLVLWCGAIAALPDADLLLPHGHRTATHSITATLIVFIIATVVTGKVTRATAVRLALALAAAHATHLLLDWLGTDHNPPAGLQMFWPFDPDFYVSGWDIFPPVARGQISTAMLIVNLRAGLWEIALVGPVAAAAWLFRRSRAMRAGRTQPG